MLPVDLYEELESAGVIPDSVIHFDDIATPRHIRYLDLLSKNNSNDTILPDAVIESAGQPYLYVVRHDRLGDAGRDQSRLAELIRALACRSDARFLGVVKPGSIDIYPVGLFHRVPEAMLSSSMDSSILQSLLSGAAFGSDTATNHFNTAISKQWLEGLLFRLLTDAAHGIRRAAQNLSEQQVIALVGRALFFRFLVDRGIVAETDVSTIASRSTRLTDVFSTPANLMEVCQWMDLNFNGDLLSVGDKDYKTLLSFIGGGTEEVCRHLSNIQYRAVDGQLPLDWGGIEFRHVPVDMLSQVYEDFAHEFVPEMARATSIHFTPRRLAEIVLDGAFGAVQSVLPHKARVLDPAVGGGVFLVLAFRRLVAERWREKGVRPTRAVIREVLMTQLTGFDKNCDALNIAALSLYLAALELDPKPSPLSDLKFDKLIGTVLHPMNPQGLGSLSPEVLRNFRQKFDIVIGNPPWTGVGGADAVALNKTLSQLMMGPGIGEGSDATTAPSIVRARYGSPDIPFLLAATHWAKPLGALGFALHARFLFQSESFELRKHVFKSMRVTGIMNFAALSQDSRLWPSNSAPFVLLVARNEPARHDDSFYFISPKYEPQLSHVGQFRIDPGAATPISIRSVQEDISVLRAVYKGGALGAELLRRIRGSDVMPMGESLLQRYGVELSNGYQLGKEEKRTRNAKHLLGLPIVTTDISPFEQANSGKEIFSYPKAEWPRDPSIFKGPLLLLRASPKSDRRSRGAMFFETDTAYTNAFFGLSITGRPELRPLADLLLVLSYSDLLLYYQLLISPKFGVERKSSLQVDLEDFPLVNIESLTSEQMENIRMISSRLQKGDPCWTEVDDLVCNLYGLSSWDRQLILDTLEFELPFIDNINRSNMPTTVQSRTDFADTFNNLVEPFTENDDQPTQIVDAIEVQRKGWKFIHIGPGQVHAQKSADIVSADFRQFTSAADSYWASRLTLHLSKGKALIGYLDQRRYWSKTQARLLALEWLQTDTSLS